MENQTQQQASPQAPQTPKLPGVIKLLKDSFLVYKLRFKTIIVILAIYLLFSIFFVALTLFGGIIIALVFAVLFKNPSIMILAIIFAIIAVIITTLIFNWLILTLLTSVVFYRENMGVVACFKYAFKKTIKYIWLEILTSFSIFAALFFFVIPGLIFIVWFSLATYVLLAENIGGMNALLKSREYVRGRFFAVVWRLIFIVVFITSIEFIFNLISDYLKKVDAPVYLSFVFQIPVLLIAPIAVAYMFLLYDNLKFLKGDFVFVPSKKLKRFIILTISLELFLFIFITVVLIAMPGGLRNIPLPTRNPIISPTPYQYLSPTPFISTEGWQTSLDRESKIQIKYPPDWVMRESTESALIELGPIGSPTVIEVRFLNKDLFESSLGAFRSEANTNKNLAITEKVWEGTNFTITEVVKSGVDPSNFIIEYVTDGKYQFVTMQLLDTNHKALFDQIFMNTNLRDYSTMTPTPNP